MEGVFVFDNVLEVGDHVVSEIVKKVTTDDLTKALIREDTKLRKLFYRNMSLDELKNLDHKLKTVDTFTGYDKRMAQKKILEVVSEFLDKDTRFQNGFDTIEEFEEYLLARHQPEKPYGIFDN